MNILIDKHGMLSIERGGEMKPQRCPENSQWGQCGDWCPKFGEPESGALRICDGVQLQGTIEDKRGKGK